jgi:hypothetical protein
MPLFRPEGYYWIRLKDRDDWEIAWFYPAVGYTIMKYEHYISEDEIAEVGDEIDIPDKYKKREAPLILVRSRSETRPVVRSVGSFHKSASGNRKARGIALLSKDSTSRRGIRLVPRAGRLKAGVPHGTS